MSRKLICRILGALSSALIIVSVFVPYVTSGQYTTNLWDMYEMSNSLYLPIMIIVFGVIGVIFFSLNIKTEFAYMSSGAMTFFAIMKTVEAINQDGFGYLSIGYYFLVIGSVLTGILAFICNLKPKVKKEDIQVNENQNSQTSMLEQIDKLYNEQTVEQPVNPTIQPVETVVQPVQPIPVEPIPVEQPINQVNVQPVVEPISVQPIEQPVQPPVVSVETIQSTVESIPVQPINQVQPQIQQPVNEVNVQTIPVNPQPVMPQNPVLQEFSMNTNQETQPIQQNPVLSEFSVNNSQSLPINSQSNPVMQDFSVNSSQSAIPTESVQPVEQQPIQQNPVVQEFMNPGMSPVPQNNNSNNSGVDIFGQPLN